MTQKDRARKAEAREGGYTQVAKALERSEPGKRAQHYRKGRKRNLSRARRRVDAQAARGLAAFDAHTLHLTFDLAVHEDKTGEPR